MDGWPMPPIPAKTYGVTDLKKYGKRCRNEALEFVAKQIKHNTKGLQDGATREAWAEKILSFREDEEQ